MIQSFICEKCGSTSYEQFSQTQVKCMQCSHVSFYDTGYRVAKQFELSSDKNVLDFVEKINYKKASLGKRFVNYVIDVFFFVLLVLAIQYISVTTNLTHNIAENSILLFLILSMFCYYVFMEYKFGKTFGKFVTRTKVVSTSGTELTLGQCVKRTLCRFIPFERFSGLINNEIFWHDSIPNTLVVEDEV
ncbi:MAG: putative rane protein/domain protein [Bacteroidota bacterium]|nr:putative rane protein/domain protein [Bacteroidota bacterium]